jgi:putative DNA primase/helicase
MMNLHALAKQWGGEVCNGEIRIPGPGHTSIDRSLAVRPSGQGFVVYTFSNRNTWQECRDYVEDLLGGHPIKFDLKQSDTPRPDTRPRALAIWAESQPWQGSLVETYLAGRGVTLPTDCVDVRFNPACPMFNKDTERAEFVPAMVALMRSVSTQEPTCIHRTHLNLDGTKGRLGKRHLGPKADGVIMLTPYTRVWMHLGIGEGIETALSLRKLPELEDLPVWASTDSGQLKKFHLPNIDDLVIAVDHDEPDQWGRRAGEDAAKACAKRAVDSGTKATLFTPTKTKTDLNDLVKGAAQ